MKTIVTTLAIFTLITFSSCKKCLTCSNKYGTQEICEGNTTASKALYKAASNGTITDDQGEPYVCK